MRPRLLFPCCGPWEERLRQIFALRGGLPQRSLSDLADVEAAADVGAVLDRLGSGKRWDLILCDLLMPGMSGMDLYRGTLRVAPDAAPSIVFMTAGAFTGRARAFLEGVHNPCLEKPLDVAKLRNIVGHAGRQRAGGSE
jgi:CheY-like chemotaxis protein